MGSLSILLQAQAESALEFILESDILDSTTTSISLIVMEIAAIMAPFFYALTLTYNFLKNLFVKLPDGNGAKKQVFDREEFVRVTVLYVILTIGYYPLIGTVTVIGGVLQTIAPYSKTAAVQTAIEKNYEEIGSALHSVITSTASGNYGDAVSSAGTALNETANTAMAESGISKVWYGTQDLAISSIAAVIGFFVEGFALMITKLLFVLGPLVIAFSILPFNRDKFERWFQIYLNVLCIPFTCSLLDSLYNGMLGNSIANFGETDFGTFEILYIASYCLVPWITSWYVGTSDSSRLMSMALGVATTAMTKASSLTGGTGDLVKDAAKFAQGMTGKAKED